MRNILDKSHRENKTHFMFNNFLFLENHGVCERDNVEKYDRFGQTTDDYTAIRRLHFTC